MNILSAALYRRPTEVATGLALAAAIYGFLTQAGVPQTLAAIVAVAIAFVPTGISEVVDKVRGPLPLELQAAARDYAERTIQESSPLR